MTEQHLILALTSFLSLVNIIIGIIIRSVWSYTREIRNDLRAMNGRVGSLEQWRADREKFCDERHDAVNREQASLRSGLEYLSRHAMQWMKGAK